MRLVSLEEKRHWNGRPCGDNQSRKGEAEKVEDGSNPQELRRGKKHSPLGPSGGVWPRRAPPSDPQHPGPSEKGSGL